MKLADFGIAKRLGDLAADLTGTGQLVGTPKYLAPEQVVGEPVTAATDLYAVGVVLYELLAGRPPFEGDTPIATAIAHRDAAIPDVRRVRSDVPGDVAAAVTRAMAKDPADRFRSAEQMAASLRGMSEPIPVAAPPLAASSPVEPTQVMVGPVRPSRRSRAWWWAAAAGLAVGTGAAIALAQRDEDPNVSAGELTETTGAPAVNVAVATTATPTTAAPGTTATPTPPTTPPPTTAPPTVPPPPASLEELIVFVEQDPARFGEKGTEFLDELQKVQQEDGRKQSDKAAELLDHSQEWVDKGELSPELLSIAEPVLQPIADGPGNSDGPGTETRATRAGRQGRPRGVDAVGATKSSTAALLMAHLPCRGGRCRHTGIGPTAAPVRSHAIRMSASGIRCPPVSPNRPTTTAPEPSFRAATAYRSWAGVLAVASGRPSAGAGTRRRPDRGLSRGVGCQSFLVASGEVHPMRSRSLSILASVASSSYRERWS